MGRFSEISMAIPSDYERVLSPMITPDMDRLPDDVLSVCRAVGRAGMSDDLSKPTANTVAALRDASKRLHVLVLTAEQRLQNTGAFS